MNTPITIQATTLREIAASEEVVIALLRGGDASDARDAVCVDLDRGIGTRGEDWAALVRRDRLDALLSATGATLLGEPTTWDGSRFGDGSRGCVEREGGEIVGEGLYRPAVN